MAKRELSSTLRNLKFMQRASQKEEQTKKEEEVKPAESFFPSGIEKKCVVIMEGDPHPGAIKGRMSFLSFNPSIDKLNEQATNSHQPEANAKLSNNQSGRVSRGENGSLPNRAECSNVDEANDEDIGDLKRKQPEEASETRYPNKSPKSVQDGQQSSPNNHKGSYKQPKREKLDWNLLRPSKSQSKSGGCKR